MQIRSIDGSKMNIPIPVEVCPSATRRRPPSFFLRYPRLGPIECPLKGRPVNAKVQPGFRTFQSQRTNRRPPTPATLPRRLRLPLDLAASASLSRRPATAACLGLRFDRALLTNQRPPPGFKTTSTDAVASVFDRIRRTCGGAFVAKPYGPKSKPQARRSIDGGPALPAAWPPPPSDRAFSGGSSWKILAATHEV